MIKKISKDIKKRVDQKVQDLAIDTMKSIIHDAEVNSARRYGVNNRLIGEFFYTRTGTYSWIVGNNNPKSKLLEFGSPPHIINARLKPMLVFETSYTMERIGLRNADGSFRKGYNGGYLNKTFSVDHPGFEGEKYLKNAIDLNMKLFYKRLKL